MDNKNILAKMHAIMLDVPFIQKNAQNSFHGYKYANELAIKKAVGAAMREHKVVFFLSTSNVRTLDHLPNKNNKPEASTIIDCQYTFYDCDSGESLAGTFVASGPDRDDKGLWAATTNAIKYIFTTTFLIPTGDDAESDTNHPAQDTKKVKPQGKKPASPSKKPTTTKPPTVPNPKAPTDPAPVSRKAAFLASLQKHGCFSTDRDTNYALCASLLDSDHAVRIAEEIDYDPGLFAVVSFTPADLPGEKDIVWTILNGALDGVVADDTLKDYQSQAQEKIAS